MIKQIYYWLYAYRIYIAVAVIMTMMTSVFLYYTWKISERKLETNGYHFLVPLGLYIQLPLHLFPAAFLIADWLEMHYHPWKGDFLWGSPFLVRSLTAFLLVWAAGCLFFTIRHILRDIRWHALFGRSIECDKRKQELFRDICRQLKIKPGKIQLFESFHAHTPLLIGILRPKVIFPEGIHYTEEELRMIFFHELAHYRQHALLLRKAAAAVSIFQWMNPVIRLYRSQIVRQTEFFCDEEASGKTGKNYYAILARFGEQGCIKDNFICASLGEGGCSILERIEKAVIRKTTKKSLRKTIRVLLLSCILFITLAAAGTAGIAEAYVIVLRKTEVDSEPDAPQEHHLEEYFSAQIDPDVPEEEIILEGIFAVRSLQYVYWVVPSGVRYKSGPIALAAGDELTVAGAIDPGNHTVRVGIIFPDSQATEWVNVQGGFNHTFSITESGNYRFYVENNCGITVEAGITLFLQ